MPRITGRIRKHRQSAQNSTASNLGVRLRQFVGEDIESMQSISHSPDLADKYKHKPAQLSRPNRKCYLYEDMRYRSNFKAEETRRENRKMNSSDDESTRPPKHQKANTKAEQVSKPLHYGVTANKSWPRLSGQPHMGLHVPTGSCMPP